METILHLLYKVIESNKDLSSDKFSEELVSVINRYELNKYIKETILQNTFSNEALKNMIIDSIKLNLPEITIKLIEILYNSKKELQINNKSTLAPVIIIESDKPFPKNFPINENSPNKKIIKKKFRKRTIPYSTLTDESKNKIKNRYFKEGISKKMIQQEFVISLSNLNKVLNEKRIKKIVSSSESETECDNATQPYSEVF